MPVASFSMVLCLQRQQHLLALTLPAAAVGKTMKVEAAPEACQACLGAGANQQFLSEGGPQVTTKEEAAAAQGWESKVAKVAEQEHMRSLIITIAIPPPESATACRVSLFLPWTPRILLVLRHASPQGS